jgi:hypothetical protein
MLSKLGFEYRTLRDAQRASDALRLGLPQARVHLPYPLALPPLLAPTLTNETANQ